MANTSITTIKTSQAPDAKPVAVNINVDTTWDILIEVPNYEVPELVFGGSYTVETGVGEVISPLILCNTTATTATIDLKVYRYESGIEYYILRNMQIPGYDTIPIPINGQFFKTGDTLEIKSGTPYAIHATLSFTLGQSEEDDV